MENIQLDPIENNDTGYRARRKINTALSVLSEGVNNAATKEQLEEVKINSKVGTLLLGDKDNIAAIKLITDSKTGHTYKADDTGDYWTYKGENDVPYNPNLWVNIGKILPSDALLPSDVTDKVEESTKVVQSKAVYDALNTIDLIDSTVDGGIFATGATFNNVEVERSLAIKVKKDDVLVYSGMIGGSNAANVNLYSSSTPSASSLVACLLQLPSTAVTDREIIVTSDGYVIASSRKVGTSGNTIKLALNKKQNIAKEVNGLSENVSSIEDNVHDNTLSIAQIEKDFQQEITDRIAGRYITSAGVIRDGLATTEATDYVPARSGDKFLYSAENGSSVIPMAAYDSGLKYIMTLVPLSGSVTVSDNQLVTIPQDNRIAYVVAMSRIASASQSGKTLKLTKTLSVSSLDARISSLEKSGGLPSIMVVPLPTDTVSLRYYRKFQVHSLIPHLGEYLVHEFWELWNRTTNNDRGWFCPYIKFRGNIIAYGEFNWIHMIAESSQPDNPFYKEGAYVGTSHGCEIFDREIFQIDGVNFIPGEFTDTLYGDRFRMLTQAMIYAVEKDKGSSGDNGMFKLDSEGNPIPSTRHWMDITIEGNNILTLDNKLEILRNNTAFNRCMMGMLSCRPDYFQYEQIRDVDWSTNYYPYNSGDTERQPAQAIAPSTKIIGIDPQYPFSDTSLKWGENGNFRFMVKCTAKSNNPADYGKANHVFMRSATTNKTYFSPIRIYPVGNPDVFNIGDVVSGRIVTEFNVNEIVTASVQAISLRSSIKMTVDEVKSIESEFFGKEESILVEMNAETENINSLV